MTETRVDGFLDGRLRLAQPVRGYRAGADAVMLAAACSAQAGDSVLELGCGAGVAGLCLGWRVPGVAITGLERQADYAQLARDNADANGIAMTVLTADLEKPPTVLREAHFDHVIMNPPYFLGGTPAPDPGRAEARREQTPLALWLDAGLRRLRPGGLICVIQRADRLDGVMAGLWGRAGGVAILPIAARLGCPAGRVLVVARKGARSPLRLLPPLITHAAPSHRHDAQDLSPAAAHILRDGTPIDMGFAKAA